MPDDAAAGEAVAVDAQRLTSAVADIFTAVGIAAADAQVVAADLVAADLEGVASHGVMLVPMYVDRINQGSVSRRSVGDIVSDRGAAIVIDAANALGQLTARQAVKLAVARAREIGLAAVAVRNGFHFGTAGRYARMMAEQNCVGIVLSNTRPLMPPPGGAEAMVGNNPIAIALPSAGEFPVEADMALSATAMGKIRLAAAAGQRIPDDWAVDSQGRPTTDPVTAIKGMLLLWRSGRALSLRPFLSGHSRRPLPGRRAVGRAGARSGDASQQVEARPAGRPRLCAGRAGLGHATGERRPVPPRCADREKPPRHCRAGRTWQFRIITTGSESDLKTCGRREP
jgi:hypothetical protein